MRISFNWLKDYIDIKLPTEKLAEVLTMAGLTVDAIHNVSGDTVFEVEITSNRPDWLSYIGVARELAALTGAKLKVPKTRAQGPGSRDKKISVKIEDKKLCPRYTARVIRNVKVGESPAWLKTKLEAMGLRPVNNIVDITNFCLFETGEPMHAFDLDKIEGGEVNVRRARPGEKIATIDGAQRTLDNNDLVIADAKKPIAIAGVMGGLNAEVNYSTQNILLEAAYFDPISTRRTSKKLAVSTESSYRFERKVDLANILYSSDRAAGLINEIANGVVSELVDIGIKTKPVKTVALDYKKLNAVLGVKIAPAKAKKILTALGLKAGALSKDKAAFRIPGFRCDLNDEIDLIEEVARIYGYSNIPATIPAIVDQPTMPPYDMVIAKKVRDILTGLGMDEIITYSLVGRKMLSGAGIENAGIVEIANPLTNEQEVMRPSLVPGLLNAVLWNINRKEKNLRLFEIGKAYLKDDGGKFSEKKILSLGISGEIASWASPARAVNLFDLKGIVETLFAELDISTVSFKRASSGSFSGASCASIEIAGKGAGTIGEISRKVSDNFDIKEKVYACEICFDAVCEGAAQGKRFHQLPKYPSVWRDISIVVDKNILNADLTELMRQTASATLKGISLIDRYEGKQIPDGKVSLTYRLEYRDMNKTLEEKELSSLHAKVLSALDEKFGAKLR